MKRVECLDGLRGLAALWVLFGHAMLLTGFKLPILGQPDMGVDLFILLSGFLMTFQYQLRSSFEDWGQVETWKAFWVRRFFRIAPLFYVLLTVAIMFGSSIYADRQLIDSFFGNTQQLSTRYNDSSLTNVLMHVSFLFGLVPSYAFRTPLPDWSLGLEMQFYAAFPIVILVVRRVGWIKGGIGVALVGAVVGLAAPRLGAHFPMPSFLPLKLHLFLSGMMIAVALHNRSRLLFYLAMALLCAALPIGGPHNLRHLVVRESLVFGFFALVHFRSSKVVDRASRLLGSTVFHWLGELSFGIYLLHLLLMHRVVAWTIQTYGTTISPLTRFSIVVLIVGAAGYTLAFATYRLVEQPGQKLGRIVLKRLRFEKRQAVQVQAEELAAP